MALIIIQFIGNGGATLWFLYDHSLWCHLPDDGRVTDTGGRSCNELRSTTWLRNRVVRCGGGSGGVGNFKCTKAHHRGQRQDTLIQPTRFCPPGVCLFKISSKECYSIQSGLKICVWHKLSCDLIALSILLRPTYVDLLPPLPSVTNLVKDFWRSPFVGS